MKRCCINCFGDYAIREFIEEFSEVGDGDYCGSKAVATGEISAVGRFVREGLNRIYITEMKAPSKELSIPKDLGGEIATRVAEQRGKITEAAKKNKLAKDLLSSYGGSSIDNRREHRSYWFEEGKALLYPRDRLYGPLDSMAEWAWEDFKDEVMHEARFFDVNESRKTIIGPLSDLLDNLKGSLGAKSKVFRARLSDGDLEADAWKVQESLGPPPANLTKHSRMSPPGISYLYAAGDATTCVAEIQPNVGREVWVAQFVVLKDIKLLDLTSFVVGLSIFHPDFDKKIPFPKAFLTHFYSEISQPTRSHDNLLEYIPTQVFAEFARTLDFEGIAYNSTQHPTGVNYTLFCSPDDNVHYGDKRPYFHEWLRLEKVTTVSVDAVTFNTSDKRVVDFSQAHLRNPNDPKKTQT